MKKLFTAGALVVAGAFIVGFMALGGFSTEAGEAVLVRGIVKPGGTTDTINLYITHVASSADPSKIRGIRTDVNVGSAKKYKWINQSGALTKVATSSNAVPEQEVVVRGTLLSDNRITASWVVQNYRSFEIEGKLQERTLDTGKTDEGWLTVNVTSSNLRGITPARAFKETSIKGKDLRIRVNGQSSVMALGKVKHLDEVTAGQQKVKIEGQVLDEDNWVSSKVYEVQE